MQQDDHARRPPQRDRSSPSAGDKGRIGDIGAAYRMDVQVPEAGDQILPPSIYDLRAWRDTDLVRRPDGLDVAAHNGYSLVGEEPALLDVDDHHPIENQGCHGSLLLGPPCGRNDPS